MKIAYVMVTYPSYDYLSKSLWFSEGLVKEAPMLWTRRIFTMFRQFFPKDLLVVVEHSGEQEIKDLVAKSADVVLPPLDPENLPHGFGIDRAVEWCKQNQVDTFVHFEPDCDIKGRAWANNLCAMIEKGYWMSGFVQPLIPYIHPCPSAWLIGKITGSFNNAKITTKEKLHREFTYYLARSQKRAIQPIYREQYPKGWDTGARNWYYAAMADKAIAIEPTSDFKHYGSGRQHPPD